MFRPFRMGIPRCWMTMIDRQFCRVLPEVAPLSLVEKKRKPRSAIFTFRPIEIRIWALYLPNLRLEQP